MDQLRVAWGWLQRHHFWVLTLVAVLVALGCWWRGANVLLAEYESNKSKIESEFNAASSVQNKPFHANENVQQAQNEEIVNQQKSVRQLWEQLYERQTASVLKWPSNLSKEFRDYIEKLKFGDSIPSNLRRHYNNYIQNHFPELPKIVGALEDTGSGASGMGNFGRGAGSFNIQNFMAGRAGQGRGGPEGATADLAEEPDFIVIWADQQLIRDELAPRSTPSAKRIWKTQEDLWVYEALLQIIANTNKAAHADRFSNAVVRVIQSLEVGRTAAQASRGAGRIEMIAAAGDPNATGENYGGRMGEGGPEMMDQGGYGGRGEMGAEYGMGGRGGAMSDAAADDLELLNNRYVDANGAPIADPGDGNPAAFGNEFKRLPVRMILTIDQRWLPQLIAECANAPLQVEVQEVRINPDDAGGSMGGGGRSGYGTMSNQAGETMTPEAEPNIKTVIIQGIIYIFNPPTDVAADASGQVAGVQ
jgi:hypothetical protein